MLFQFNCGTSFDSVSIKVICPASDFRLQLCSLDLGLSQAKVDNHERNVVKTPLWSEIAL